MGEEPSWTAAVQLLENQLAAGKSRQPIDIVYLFRHGKHNDAEIRYSLRSVAANLPFIRKVWIFGDRPEFLAADKSIVEHVPHEYLAPLFGFRTPVRSDFLMQFLASLIPELTPDFVRFADDYILLQPLSPDQLMIPRALEDLNQPQTRGQGKYKELVWLTYDVLKHYGFAGINFESHVPQPLSKRLMLESFLAFRECLSEERLECLTTLTCAYNYAIKYHGLKFAWLHEQPCRVGFYGARPTLPLLNEACRGKSFLNFDDRAWGPEIEHFLHERFPSPSKFELVDAKNLGSTGPPMVLPRVPSVEATPQAVQAPEHTSPTTPAAALASAFGRAIASRGQMSPPQYFRIASELIRRGPCNLLIIGAGRDTELYARANTGGRTTVVERHGQWIEQVRHLDCEIIPVVYTSRLSDGLLEPCSPPDGIPQSILEEKWDVILIDGPEGNGPEAPGRQQSVFLASQLAGAETTVFLHDYNRPAEHQLAAHYLKPADEVLGRSPALAVFSYTRPV